MSNTETMADNNKETATTVGLGAAGGDDALPSIGPGDTVGRYQIRGLLGTGGMGQVFTAFDPELGRSVALKVIRPDGQSASSRARMRLLREAQALARLQHPNVVDVYDVGTEGDQVFIAMELVAGQTLAAWLISAARTWREILDVFVAAGRGLAAAHAAGIVHRDFKPGNVIVGGDRVVLVDFGLACSGDDLDTSDTSRSGRDTSRGRDSVLDVNVTLTGERVGTPRYMAPEQHSGRAVTTPADQFAFATALWEALYGVPPFPGRSAIEVLRGMALGPSMSPADRKVPERIRAALVRALAFRAEDRWPTLGHLLDELGRDPRPARRRRLAVLALTLAASMSPLAFVAGQHSTLPTDPHMGHLEITMWNDAARMRARARFLVTGVPKEAESFERIDLPVVQPRETGITQSLHHWYTTAHPPLPPP